MNSAGAQGPGCLGIFLLIGVVGLLVGVFEGGDEERSTVTVGPPARCEQRLEAKMTASYLRESHEVASVDALTKASQIAATCRQVPSSFSVIDAADLAGGELAETIRER